jgi:hypothetical protein
MVSITRKVASERRSSADHKLYERFAKALKLENILPIDRAVKG